jgi:predicted nucleotidyltransferase
VVAGLQPYPDLLRLLSSAVDVLMSRDVVAGIVLSGSVAVGSPDTFSDVDILAVVADDALSTVWEERAALAQVVGGVVLLFDLTEIVPYSSAIYYRDGTKLHLTYRGLSALSADPDYARARCVYSRTPEISGWLGTCEALEGEPDLKRLLRDDERFWFWVLQGACKIPRGELWAAFDTLHLLRSIVISSISAISGHPFEGFRRVETHLDDRWRRELDSGVVGLSRHDLSVAYCRIVRTFTAVRLQADVTLHPQWNVSSDTIDFVATRLTCWLGPAEADLRA